ncbi:F-box/LRR-repeat protein 10 [Linum perenne]
MATADTTAGSGAGEPEGYKLNELPEAILSTIISKLDVASICSVACTCKPCSASASHLFTFMRNFYLLDFALPADLLKPLLLRNPYLKSMIVDCHKLDDSATEFLLQRSLEELSLHDCCDFSGKLLREIGARCPDLRHLYLGCIGEKNGRFVGESDIETFLSGCTQLEELYLMFEVYLSFRGNLHQAWAQATKKLKSLEIGYIPSVMATELFSPNLAPLPPNSVAPSTLPVIQKLCLRVDYITDAMVVTISSGLATLTHLDLQDAPLAEPIVEFDLTDSGLMVINQHRKLKHLSIIRSQEYFTMSFRRVTDLGLISMANNCGDVESLCLGGFCHVTNSGYNAMFLLCPRLQKLEIRHANHLTEPAFRSISERAPSLTHIILRWCYHLTSMAVEHLVSNPRVEVLDLRECMRIDVDSLEAIGRLSSLKVLKLDGTEVTDDALLFLSPIVMKTLLVLSLRGCTRLTDQCISWLFHDGTSTSYPLQELDLSGIPGISDVGIVLLCMARVRVTELRLRQCPLITNVGVAALASRRGNRIRMLDIYNCSSITRLAPKFFWKPYFPKLRWLGISRNVNRGVVTTLGRERPFVRVECHGDELGPRKWDSVEGSYVHLYEEYEMLQRWLVDEDDEFEFEFEFIEFDFDDADMDGDDEGMVDDNNVDMVNYVYPPWIMVNYVYPPWIMVNYDYPPLNMVNYDYPPWNMINPWMLVRPFG